MNVGHRYYQKDYNLPSDIKFCKRCVNSNQRPRLKFDADGICSACHFSDIKNNKIGQETSVTPSCNQMSVNETNQTKTAD